MDGNKVYINDAKAYISAEPHTLYESGWVYFTIISKQYTGNVDIAFGFDIENVQPKKAERYNGGGWVNFADKFDSIYWTHDNLTKWYYAKNLPVVAGNTYTVRVWVNIPISTTKISGKYGFAIKSSAQTLQQAKDTGNLYYLDPWFNSSWTTRKNITVTTNGTSTPAWYQVKLNITYAAEMQTGFDDIRFIASDEVTPLSHWIESKVNSSYANVWVNLSDAITDPGSDNIWIYYGNAAASSESDGNATFLQWHGTATADFHDSNVVSVPFIYEASVERTSSDAATQINFGMSEAQNTYGDDSVVIYPLFAVDWKIAGRTYNNGVGSYTGAISGFDWGLNTPTKIKIVAKSSVAVDFYFKNSVSADATLTTNIPNEPIGLVFYQFGGTGRQNYSFARKYIANEPTYSIGSAENYLISSWGNDYTNNQDLSFTIDSNKNILFNITRVYSDPIFWFVNGVNQSHPYDNLSVLIDNVGITNVTATVTNSTDSQPVIWLVTLSMQLTTPTNGSTVYNPYPPAAPEVTFAWTSTGYPYYNLQISTDPYFNYIVSSTYHSAETADIYLLSDEQYYWKVRTYEDAYTPGDWSSTSSFNLTSNYSVSGYTGIAGIVYEKKSDGSLIPIQDASVYIRSEFLNWSSSQVTGTNGYYLFDNLTNSTVYSIYAKASGYEDSVTEYVTTVPATRVTKNILLTKCISGFNCGFLTQPVTFTVRNLFDQEFPGVTVVVYKGDELTAYDTGITDSGGSVTFMLNKDVKYRVTFTGGGISGPLTYYAFGSQTNYRIMVISGFPDGGDRYDYVSTNLTTSNINATHSNLALVYNDSLSSTSSISFYATNLTTGTTCWSNSTSQAVTLNCSVISSGTYRFGFNAVSSTYGTIQQDKIINFNAATSAGNPLFGKVDATLLHWGSIMLIVFMAAMFSIKTVKIGAVIVPAMALVFWSMDWLDVNFLHLATAMCLGVMVYMRMSEHKVEAY